MCRSNFLKTTVCLKESINLHFQHTLIYLVIKVILFLWKVLLKGVSNLMAISFKYCKYDLYLNSVTPRLHSIQNVRKFLFELRIPFDRFVCFCFTWIIIFRQFQIKSYFEVSTFISYSIPVNTINIYYFSEVLLDGHFNN